MKKVEIKVKRWFVIPMSLCFIMISLFVSCKGKKALRPSNTWVIRSLTIKGKEIKNRYSDTFSFAVDSGLLRKCSLNSGYGFCRMAQITSKDSVIGKWRDISDSSDRYHDVVIIESNNLLQGKYRSVIIRDTVLMCNTLRLVSDSVDIFCVGL